MAVKLSLKKHFKTVGHLLTPQCQSERKSRAQYWARVFGVIYNVFPHSRRQDEFQESGFPCLVSEIRYKYLHSLGKGFWPRITLILINTHADGRFFLSWAIDFGFIHWQSIPAHSWQGVRVPIPRFMLGDAAPMFPHTEAWRPTVRNPIVL